MLEISGLKVVRGSFTVSLPELTVADGQCVALCGVSGSGKSTLMEAMALLTPALEVENFVLDGVAVDELPEKQQQAVRICAIGIMPQTGGLIPYLTVRENLELQIRMALRQQVTPVFDRKTSADGKPCPCYSNVATVDSATANSISGEGLSTNNLGKSIDEVAAQARAKAREFVSAEGELEVQEQQVEDNRNVRIAAMQMSLPVDSIDAQAATQLIPRNKRKASAEALVHAELTPEECTAKRVTIRNAESAEEVKNRLQILNPYIARMGLELHLDKLPEQLSIGQRQRALFLRAIAHKPRLLLMDEPTSSLDPDNASELFTIIEEIAHASGMSVLLITHDNKAASRYTRYVYDAARSHSDYSVFSFYDESDDYEDDDVNFYSGRAIDYPSVPHLLNAAYDMQHTKHAAIVQHSISAAHSTAAHASADNAGLARAGLEKSSSKSGIAGSLSTNSVSNMAGSEHLHTSAYARIGGFSDAISTESGGKDFKSPYPHAGDIIYDHTGHLYSAHGRITYYTTPPEKLKHLQADDKYSNIVISSSKRGHINKPAAEQASPAAPSAQSAPSAKPQAQVASSETAATAECAGATASVSTAAMVSSASSMLSHDNDAQNSNAAHSAAQAAEAVGSAATKAAAASAAATAKSETSGVAAQGCVSAATSQSGAGAAAAQQSGTVASAVQSEAKGAGQDDTGARD